MAHFRPCMLYLNLSIRLCQEGLRLLRFESNG